MISVAIDGPAGAGKSTIARAIARDLGYLYVDTGALYRAIGLYALEQQADPQNEGQVLPLLPQLHLSLQFANGEQQVWLNGRNVSQEIRKNEVSMAASAVSAIPKVREFLFDLQQNLAKENNVVMDGRDIGTVVLPKAQVKIFLTASPEDRARRRYEELQQRGQSVEYTQLLEEVRRRDYNDAHRAAAPLRRAEDALLVDTTGNSLEQSIVQLTKIVKERLQDVL